MGVHAAPHTGDPLDRAGQNERQLHTRIRELEATVREWQYRAERAEDELEGLADRLEQYVRLRGL